MTVGCHRISHLTQAARQLAHLVQKLPEDLLREVLEGSPWPNRQAPDLVHGVLLDFHEKSHKGRPQSALRAQDKYQTSFIGMSLDFN